MSSKTMMVMTLLLAVCYTSVGIASEASDYIGPGRKAMFEGTLSGLRTAYYIFDDGLNDASCTDCDDNRELRFLHALTRSYMLLIRDDGSEIDSALELAREFGINIKGDSFFPFALELDTIPLDDHGNYEIPAGAPDAEQIREILDTQTIPELGGIIAELELITDEPGDRFQVFFVPKETGLRENLEVDYGDVLILKGLLTAAKGLMEAESAYDIFIDPNDMIAEKIYGDSFHVNEDLLAPYPNLLKVLPTEGHPEDGAALLAQARQDLVASIDYYMAAIEYIRSEEDEQENDLLYIDPYNDEAVDLSNEKLILIKKSLLEDTSIIHPLETIDTYEIQDTDLNDRGEMTLVYNPLDLGEGGQLTLIDEHGLPRVWKIGDFEIVENELFAEMELDIEQEPPYTGWHDLSDANSLLFEPDGDTSYICTILDESLYTNTGTARGWHAMDASWYYILPFAFDFYGTTYTSVHVCSNGFLDFASPAATEYESYWSLFNNIRIAPLWEYYLSTENPYDIYIDDTIPDQVSFRWHTLRNYYGGEFNFSVTLYSDGRIRFDYGSNTRNGQVVGISRGNNSDYVLVGSGWGDGLLTAEFSPDRTRFGNAVVEYWGNLDGTMENLWGERLSRQTKTKEVDLNPIFGSTPRYPNPVPPRDLLPEFDYYNFPLPGTVGQGLMDKGASADFAASLGGILPGTTQLDWITQANLQPEGEILLQEVIPQQLVEIDGDWFVNLWEQNQEVFTDIEGDTDNAVSGVKGIDINSLCLGYDNDNLYGCILLYDELDLLDGGGDYYELRFSYVPGVSKAIGSFQFRIHVNGDSGYLDCYYKVNNSGWDDWEYFGRFDVWVTNEKTISFFVPWSSMPASLPGRFISLHSQGWNSSETERDGEKNHTHIQITGWDGTPAMATVSGQITCVGEWLGGPIYIQAYTDPHDPDGSLVASVMLLEPGDYTLTGIGLGFEGYIRAFAPVYGFNPFACTPIVEDIQSINVSQQNTTGIDFVLTTWHDYCGMAVPLTLDTPYNGSTNGATGEDITDRGWNDALDVWHSFDCTGDGVYQIDITSDFEHTSAVFDRCGGDEMAYTDIWLAEPLYFNAQAGETYRIRVAGEYYGTGNYEVLISYYDLPIENDLCENAMVIDPNTTYAGTTVGATGTDITERADYDIYDVWYTFTPEINGVYQVHRVVTSGFEDSTWNSTSVAVYDRCGGTEIGYARPRDPNAYFNARADSEYLIRIAGSWWGTGTFELTVSPYSKYIPNDECENATVIEPDITLAGSTVGTSGEDITERSRDDIYDVWYSFTPDSTAIYRIYREVTSGFELSSRNSTSIAVFDSCSCITDFVAFGRPIDPYTDLLAEADKTYYIRIAGDRLSTGTFNLTVSYERDPLPNDDISNAIPLIVNQPEDGTTIGATGVEMSSCLWRDFYDIWYSFTPRHGGTYTFTLENTDFDAGATVYRLEYFEWLGTFEIETCINPWADQPATFQAIAGVTYYIRIAGDYFTKGNFTITCKKQFTADMNDDGKVDLNDQEQLLNHWLDSNCQSSNWCDGADLDFSGKVDLGDYVIFVRNWLEGTGP